MIPKLHVILRTCDRSSLQSNRPFAKNEIVIRCLRSLIATLHGHDYSLHIIDDDSSNETKRTIQEITVGLANITFLLPSDTDIPVKQKSRVSVKEAYDYIKTLPNDDLVYIVEDDYLHYPDAVDKMLKSWAMFTSWDPDVDVGIFPQDFRQLYFHPDHPFNNTYVRPCVVVPGADRYYRTTWFTHESFMIKNRVIKQYQTHFDSLLDIGFTEGAWEGNTISNVWQQPNVRMMMPLGTHAVHISDLADFSFFTDNWQELWELYK